MIATNNLEVKILYKKNLEDVVERNKKLWAKNFTNKVLAKIDIDGYSTLDLWMKTISPLYCPDYKKMFDCYIEQFEMRKNLLDDAIPTARPQLGCSMYGAFFGAPASFGETGGYTKPILNDINKMKLLKYDFNNFWLDKQIKATEYFVKEAHDKCGVSIIETFDSLNLAENLFGSDFFIYLVEPENFKKVLEFFDFALEFAIKLTEEQRKYIEKYKGGYFDVHEIWVPNNTTYESIDAWGSCSTDTFNRLGKYHVQKLFNYFGGGWLHVHNRSLHLLEEIVKIKNLVGLNLLDDPNVPRCFPRLKEIQRITKDVPLQINCTKNELLDGIKNKTLCRDVMYWIYEGVKSIEEANNIMELVYSY